MCNLPQCSVFCRQHNFFVMLICNPRASHLASAPLVAPVSLCFQIPLLFQARYVDAVRLSFRRCYVSRPGGALKGRFSWFPNGIKKMRKYADLAVLESCCNMKTCSQKSASIQPRPSPLQFGKKSIMGKYMKIYENTLFCEEVYFRSAAHSVELCRHFGRRHFTLGLHAFFNLCWV